MYTGPAQFTAQCARPQRALGYCPHCQCDVIVQLKPLSALSGEPRPAQILCVPWLRQSPQRSGTRGAGRTRGKTRAAPSKYSLLCPGMRRRSTRRANGGCGLPVAARVCKTAESSAEMMESSHLWRRPCAVFLQEAVAEKVRRQPGGEARVQGARGAGPTCVSWCSHRTPAPLRPRNKGCARRRRRDPGCRPRLSHPRSETRLRRALGKPPS